MGNRAVITISTRPKAPCIYLHWNGGRASVEAFLKAARELGVADVSGESAKIAALHDICNTFIGGSVYLMSYGEADTDNHDNGVYLISDEMEIARRLFNRNKEEINEQKTNEIYRECMARMGGA